MSEIEAKEFSRLPSHVGLIPDGNRRWAEARGMERREGYAAGVEAGFKLFQALRDVGIEEVTLYGFTKANVHRPPDQVEAFQTACVRFGLAAAEAGAALRVVGDTQSNMFPDRLAPFAKERSSGDLRVNMLVNYGWEWDLNTAGEHISSNGTTANPLELVATADIPRIELVVRWGGRRRLSGFLPLQCAYADIYVVDTLWPEMEVEEFLEALSWYQEQDVTLGG